jgi:S1-C subfamily serine protease
MFNAPMQIDSSRRVPFALPLAVASCAAVFPLFAAVAPQDAATNTKPAVPAAAPATTQDAKATESKAADAASDVEAALRKSVINIKVRQEARDPSTPWKRESPQEFGGSGVVIAPGKVLTNAHVVEQASEILLETNQTSLPIQAELVGIDKTRDLALLSTTDEAFIAAHPPIPVLEGLPKEGSRVVVMGYPLGGEQLSTTSGVISRIEWSDIGMTGESGMRVQVDAAINFGNSGGPAFVDGKVAGLAFSGMDNSMADNIAYLLATEEVRRFLDEIEQGKVDGNTVIGIETQTLENPALRTKLGASADVAGVVVIDQKGGPLQAWDILTKINGYSIDNKGQVTIEGDRKVAMDCAVGRFVPTAEKNTITVEYVREGKAATAEIPAFTRATRTIGSYPDGNYPYLVYGPLVFSPLHMDLLRSTGGWMFFGESPIAQFITDERPSGGKQVVAVASPLLSHPVGRGYEVNPGQSVKSVNGKTFANFAEFVQLLNDLKDEYVVFEFNERGIERLVFKRAEIEAATEKIMDSNGIRRQCSKDVQGIWTKD